MSECFHHGAGRRTVHFSSVEFDDLAAALADLARRAPASPARDALAAWLVADAPRHGGFDLDTPPDVLSAPDCLVLFTTLVATLARELAQPVGTAAMRLEPWDAGRQVHWLARLTDLHDALLATAAARGVAIAPLSLGVSPVLAQDVAACRLELELDALAHRYRRAPWETRPGDVRHAAATLITTTLAPPGFARRQAVLLHAYQRLAESCEAQGDDAAAADAWRLAAAQAPRGAYRTSLLDCADEAEQLSRLPRT
jgi:hypothetical protein